MNKYPQGRVMLSNKDVYCSISIHSWIFQNTLSFLYATIDYEMCSIHSWIFWNTLSLLYAIVDYEKCGIHLRISGTVYAFHMLLCLSQHTNISSELE